MQHIARELFIFMEISGCKILFMTFKVCYDHAPTLRKLAQSNIKPVTDQKGNMELHLRKTSILPKMCF